MVGRLLPALFFIAYLGAAQGPLQFELKRIEKKTPSCVSAFEYPEIISAGSRVARDQMNAGILRTLLRRSDWPASESGFRSLNAYSDAFMKDCAAFQRERQAHPLYEHKLVTIFRYTPPIISFKVEADEDGGGVHPFGTSFFVNFEFSTGKMIVLSDLLKEGALATLEAIAEESFRRDHNLSPKESLSEGSFNFPGDHFRLNDNFGVGQTDLVFLFNTYEIGPGAMGETQIRIPFQSLNGLLKVGLPAW